ncbi:MULTISPECIES: DUF5302 domain-containing protein [Streptomyces]|uniref:DUF5302 domain-containing protein n=1 Tax=Streptomyces cirratus TaxID=68187 RepID=A0ABQ3EZ98_9ACTN|nr:MULTISPECIES: DUF5302 domain-containing protein [Streptomyces]WUC69050.1 DUF5302 domain-containing protein [Streptomyces sp. NBC_00539]GHB76087.1 hypothetical protein GCM10010347_53260 [Streptomyces cirratus]
MTDTPENNAAENDGKRKFREALERKARTAMSQQAQHEGRLKLKGYNGPNGQNRSFRRKSG